MARKMSEVFRYLAALENIPDDIRTVCQGMLRAAEDYESRDNPEDDMTDFAHPAFWRGEEYFTWSTINVIEKVLSGKDTGEGVIADPKVEAMRRKLLRLMKFLKNNKEFILKQIPEHYSEIERKIFLYEDGYYAGTYSTIDEIEAILCDEMPRQK